MMEYRPIDLEALRREMTALMLWGENAHARLHEMEKAAADLQLQIKQIHQGVDQIRELLVLRQLVDEVTQFVEGDDSRT